MTDHIEKGATAVITHLVKPGHEADYEQWLQEISTAARQWPGHLDVQVVRPVGGVTRAFVVVLRFRERTYLERWLASDERSRFIDQVRPILAADDRFVVRSGLDFWFVPEGAQAQIPVRWKQAVVTWAAIYPLVSLLPLVLLPALHALHVPSMRWLDTLVTTAVTVCLMVWFVMPRVTRLVSGWLFRGVAAGG